MRFAVAKEIKTHEYRVGLIPSLDFDAKVLEDAAMLQDGQIMTGLVAAARRAGE